MPRREEKDVALGFRTHVSRFAPGPGSFGRTLYRLSYSAAAYFSFFNGRVKRVLTDFMTFRSKKVNLFYVGLPVSDDYWLSEMEAGSKL